MYRNNLANALDYQILFLLVAMIRKDIAVKRDIYRIAKNLVTIHFCTWKYICAATEVYYNHGHTRVV